jgi:hypothetical protein
MRKFYIQKDILLDLHIVRYKRISSKWAKHPSTKFILQNTWGICDWNFIGQAPTVRVFDRPNRNFCRRVLFQPHLLFCPHMSMIRSMTIFTWVGKDKWNRVGMRWFNTVYESLNLSSSPEHCLHQSCLKSFTLLSGIDWYHAWLQVSQLVTKRWYFCHQQRRLVFACPNR